MYYDIVLNPSEAIYNYAIGNGKGSEKDLTRLLINVLIIYILIDILCVAASYVQSPRSTKTLRRSLSNIYRFFVSGAILIVTLPWIAVNYAVSTIAGHPAGFSFNKYWFIEITTFLLVITTQFVRSGVKSWQSGRGSLPIYMPRLNACIILAVLPAVFLYLSTRGPYYYIFMRPDQWMRDVLPTLINPAKLSVSYLSCELHKDGSLYIGAVLSNETGSEFVVDTRSIGIIFAQGEMPGYYDQRYFTILSDKHTFTQPSESDTRPIQIIPPNSALAVAFRYDKIQRAAQLEKLYEEWEKDYEKSSGYDLYLTYPSCFLTYSATYPSAEKVVHVPASGSEGNPLSGLENARSGDFTLAP
jgi:hypothetical protein